MARKEIFISLDIEADGPIPGPYSMLSFACVAIDRNYTMYGTFSRNLKKLKGSSIEGHPETMKFWSRFPDMYEKARENTVNPKIAMEENKEWLYSLMKKQDCVLVYLGYPLPYDFMWHYWYMNNFTGDGDPLSFSGYDIKTAAARVLDIPFKYSNKRNFPREWFKDIPAVHSHLAEDDALEQAYLGITVMNDYPRKRRDTNI